MTLPLYRDDQTLIRFRARVIGRDTREGHPWVALDRSAFYATAGGQPHDTGVLDGRSVLDVRRDADGLVWHRVSGPIDRESVAGEIDWPRRRDHMQQHTAQHLLSRLMLDHHAAPTVGVAIGPEVSTVDFPGTDWPPSTWADLEELAATEIARARPVRVETVSRADAERMDLRKLPPDVDPVRIVSIEGLDRTSCGGTHVASTAELSPIVITGTENMGKRTRLTFLAGARARGDHRTVRRTLERMALSISARLEDVEPAWTKLQEDVRAGARRLEAANTALARERLAAWADREAASAGGVRVITRRLDPEVAAPYVSSPAAVVAALADAIAGERALILLAGWAAGDKANLFFVRSPDVERDLRPALAAALPHVDGRGGGGPGRVQGGGTRPDGIDVALATASRTLVEAAP